MARLYLHEDLHLNYIGKWLLIAGLIGVVAGLGSIVFYEAIRWATYLFLGLGAGYYPPGPLGEGQPVVREIARRWMIPVVTALGGLLSGAIVYIFAPEAEGAGNDAVIDAFHNQRGLIRARLPLIKMIASAITIGSGGSAGREGPMAQIAAGFGSILAQLFKLSVDDRRIAVVAGLGAGVGAIFKAPLGGALLSTEILYLNGFEIDALVPSFIASLIGYIIFAGYTGYVPVFGAGLAARDMVLDPVTMVYYALLGILCGLIGILYPKTFIATRLLFRRLNWPNWAKPALGGLMVGVIGVFVPQVLGMGYGWLQLPMLNTLPTLGLVFALVFLKIAATSLSIGSGGSGGVFAPGLFIGGMLGAACWQTLHGVSHLPATPLPFIVIGMMALFGAVARAPLGVMFMVGEMTGSYNLLAPAMITIGMAYILVGHNTIFPSQVPTPADSPAHRLDYFLPILRGTKVKEVMTTQLPHVVPSTPVLDVQEILFTDQIKGVTVVSAEYDACPVGVITKHDVMRLAPERQAIANAQEVMSSPPIIIDEETTLDHALAMMADNQIAYLPVMEGEILVGTLSYQRIMQSFLATGRQTSSRLEPTIRYVAQGNKRASTSC
jgi:CIC family chloride channel protein